MEAGVMIFCGQLYSTEVLGKSSLIFWRTLENHVMLEEIAKLK